MTKKFSFNLSLPNLWLFFVVVLLLLTSSTFLKAQTITIDNIQAPTETEQKEYEEYHSFSAYGENHLFFQNGDYAYNFGVRLDLQMGIFGLYYKIGLGANPNGKVYMHVPLGVEVGVALAAYTITSGSSYYLMIPALLCVIVPEGATIRVWRKDNFNLKIYASPWGSELNFSKEHFTLISGEAGLQATVINNNRYTVSCYAGTKLIYKNLLPAATIGATVGIILD